MANAELTLRATVVVRANLTGHTISARGSKRPAAFRCAAHRGAPDKFQDNRVLVTSEPFLLVEGIPQKQDGVIHVPAKHMKRLGDISLHYCPVSDSLTGGN